MKVYSNAWRSAIVQADADVEIEDDGTGADGLRVTEGVVEEGAFYDEEDDDEDDEDIDEDTGLEHDGAEDEAGDGDEDEDDDDDDAL
jgi:hypothetical protein